MKSWLRENRGLLLFLVLLGISRGAFANWNYIPSGSMRPNLLEGDLVLVNRAAYDLKLPLTHVVLARLGEPARGDVVVFESPRDGARLIKRLIGIPGDVVEMRHKLLVVNGAVAGYRTLDAAPVRLLQEQTDAEQHLIQWDWHARSLDSFAPVRIPADHYLMLGDNRDHSADSRFFGLVHRELLIGRGERILVSADVLDSWQPRFERFGRSLAVAAREPDEAQHRKAAPCLIGASDCASQDERPVEPCKAGSDRCDQSYEVEKVQPKKKAGAKGEPSAPPEPPAPASPGRG